MVERQVSSGKGMHGQLTSSHTAHTTTTTTTTTTSGGISAGTNLFEALDIALGSPPIWDEVGVGAGCTDEPGPFGVSALPAFPYLLDAQPMLMSDDPRAMDTSGIVEGPQVDGANAHAIQDLPPAAEQPGQMVFPESQGGGFGGEPNPFSLTATELEGTSSLSFLVATSRDIITINTTLNGSISTTTTSDGISPGTNLLQALDIALASPPIGREVGVDTQPILPPGDLRAMDTSGIVQRPQVDGANAHVVQHLLPAAEQLGPMAFPYDQDGDCGGEPDPFSLTVTDLEQTSSRSFLVAIGRDINTINTAAPTPYTLNSSSSSSSSGSSNDNNNNDDGDGDDDIGGFLEGIGSGLDFEEEGPWGGLSFGAQAMFCSEAGSRSGCVI